MTAFIASPALPALPALPHVAEEALDSRWPLQNLILAATALQHGLTVVTRDSGDFALARVPLLNPWAA